MKLWDPFPTLMYFGGLVKARIGRFVSPSWATKEEIISGLHYCSPVKVKRCHSILTLHFQSYDSLSNIPAVLKFISFGLNNEVYELVINSTSHKNT
jgi:hypothetical protein